MTTDNRILPYLSGWERVTLEKGDVATFRRGDFTLHLHGTHDIRLEGRGLSMELRFYQAALKVMEMEGRQRCQ